MKALLTLLFLACTGLLQAQPYPEMITVEGGTYTDKTGTKESSQEEKKITLKTYQIAKTPVTVEQYRAYCKATGKKMPDAPSWGWIDKHPMVRVRWSDAVAYADWLSEKTGKNYRLPNQSEWYFAAIGGNKSNNYTYSGGNNLGEVAWYGINSDRPDKSYSGQRSTHPVAQKQANELGLYDMSGNVWEWTRTPYDDVNYFLCGGSFSDNSTTLKLTTRFISKADARSDFFGFRVVLLP